MKQSLIVFFLLITPTLFAQSNKEIAVEKTNEAIRLMEDGKTKESIVLLKECKKLDPENYVYSYEIAFAHTIDKDYKKALKELKRTKEYKNINSQVYQMSGNCQSYLGKPEKAIVEYETGMKLFPEAGNLHLEKGNIFLQQEKYNEAVRNYENGIKVDPMYPSNYFRLAKLYTNSKNDKLSGLIYGEIFMNLERTTARTQEMSELLYQTYQKSITLGTDSSSTDFCDIVMTLNDSDLKDMENGKFKLPFCAIFGKNFILGLIMKKELNLTTISEMRASFLENYFKEDYKDYPNVLFSYQKKIMDTGHFEAYNHYLLQIGVTEQFESWLENNQQKYDDFVEWYLKEENILDVNKENLFLR